MPNSFGKVIGVSDEFTPNGWPDYVDVELWCPSCMDRSRRKQPEEVKRWFHHEYDVLREMEAGDMVRQHNAKAHLHPRAFSDESGVLIVELLPTASRSTTYTVG
jgi:hypothetical protein